MSLQGAKGAKYDNAMSGTPAPDASGPAMFSFFKITTPDVRYIYAGSLHGEETPGFVAKLTAPCQDIDRYAEANDLKSVDDSFAADGTALAAAQANGQNILATPRSYGKTEPLDGGAVKIELLVFGLGEKRNGYLGAYVPSDQFHGLAMEGGGAIDLFTCSSKGSSRSSCSLIASGSENRWIRTCDRSCYRLECNYGLLDRIQRSYYGPTSPEFI